KEKRDKAKKKAASKQGATKITTQKKKKTTKGASSSQAIDIDSGDESDGKSALRRVEENDVAQPARRGPSNGSMQYFRTPLAVKDKTGKKSWEFKCKTCGAYVNFNLIHILLLTHITRIVII
ncbi:hypothetical protein BJ912DRAFT_865185, partial [Pholiota molesta]